MLSKKNKNMNPILNLRILFTTIGAILILSIISIASVKGQMNNTVYFMDRIPQSSLFNPAVQPHYTSYVGLPLLSSINMNMGLNFASYNDIIFQDPNSDSLITFLHPSADIDDFIGNLQNRNQIGQDMHINLLRVGVRYQDMFFTFSVSEKISGRTSLPKDLFILGLKGNDEFLDKKADLSGFGADLNYYREFALGASYPVNENLTVGGSAKLLFGKMNFSLANPDISFHTDPETYHLHMHSNFTANASMPFKLEHDEEGNIDGIISNFDDEGYNAGDFIFNTGNVGFAADLGATYKITDPVPMTLYASIADLGFINWNRDVFNISMEGSYIFEGIDFNEMLDNDDDYFERLTDTISDAFVISDTQNSYNRGIGPKVYLGGTYKLNPMVNFGLLSRSHFGKGHFSQSVTLSANTNVTNWLTTTLSYSFMNNAFNNLGLGMGIRGGPVQFYILSDNLNSAFMPHKTRNVNIWFGMNLVFGYRAEQE